LTGKVFRKKGPNKVDGSSEGRRRRGASKRWSREAGKEGKEGKEGKGGKGRKGRNNFQLRQVLRVWYLFFR
jgi:hypothetical protein